ncbi:MAG: oligopeptide transporter, OPT family [Gammaproteobacteria bacterium RIFCSPHIGHO2_12_FULL_35_23]|nr:MAG: oligopeptide transporter, OPT family [Gammaproteobacteria bacterium RIFCSPHIGHO2_12_FULL_35_23]
MSKQTSIIKPLIGPEQSLPEITIKAIVLAAILVVVLCAGNAYLGLKVGTTVSASIPAAVISMGLLRFFRHSNVLENNIVQTAASVGEATAAGVAYIIPSLLLIHYWDTFHFWQTFLITLLGGCLGMLFSVPIRRVIINNPGLKFPEGTAIGTVLKASSEADSDIKPLLLGGIIGGIITLFQVGFKVVADNFQFWFSKGTVVFGLGLGLSPALLAAGYIIGINVAISVLIGVILGWGLGIPILTSLYGAGNSLSPSDTAIFIWDSYTRYMGVGTMLVGGLWTIITLLKPLCEGILASFESIKLAKLNEEAVLRTERDIPITLILVLLAVIMVAAFFVFYTQINPVLFGIGFSMHVTLAAVGAVFVILGGFLFGSISAYFAGLIGSTNSPGSGLLVSAILVFSLILILIFSIFSHLTPDKNLDLAAFAIMVCSVIMVTITISNDTMQDLKAGQIVGATPWKQQVVLILGVIIAALVIAPVLLLLFNAYGIGGIFPRPGMSPNDMLAAPQAGLIAAVVQGVFAHNLPWIMLVIGGIIALFAIFADEFLKRRGKRLPILAIGLGIYLPLASSMPVVVGGLLSFLAHKAIEKRNGKNALDNKIVRKNLYRGLLVACGLVAGASIMGVVLAIPFAIERSSDALCLVSPTFAPAANFLGVVVAAALCYWMYRVVTSQKT